MESVPPRSARFDILEKIGEGGMGSVYRVYDRLGKQTLALKALTRIDPASIYQFKTEFRTLADLDQMNLVSLYELISSDGQWFITLEYLDGVDFTCFVRNLSSSLEAHTPVLSNWLSTAYPMGLPETLRLNATPWPHQEFSIENSRQADVPAPVVDYERLRSCLLQLADGLHHIHRAGKLHRDIKPSNVFVTRDARLVLLDFGLVTEIQTRGEEALWRPVCGTPAYMSPEQIDSRPLSPKSDWYSVGLMTYEAVSGQLPFIRSCRNWTELAAARINRVPPKLDSLVQDVPSDINEICWGLLLPGLEQRFGRSELLRCLKASPDSRALHRSSLPPEKSPFIGRETDLEVLRAAHTDLQGGQRSFVLVMGGSGIGKTALVERFLAQLETDPDVFIIRGRCFEQETLPFNALDVAVDAIARHLMALPSEIASQIVPRRAQALVHAFPVLGQIVGWPRWVDRTSAINPSEIRRDAFSAFRELMTRLSGSNRTILFIDNIQWADTDSLALLDSLLPVDSGPNLLLICTSRGESWSISARVQAFVNKLKDQTSTCPVRTLSLGPLSDQDSSTLVRRLLSAAGRLDQNLIQPITNSVRGNPLFAIELAVSDLEHIQKGGGNASQQEDAKADLAYENVLQRRISRMSEPSQQLLQIVAISGRPLLPAIAFQALGLDTDSYAAQRTLRLGRLIKTDGPAGGLECYHDRIRTVVLKGLNQPTHERLHRSLAETWIQSGSFEPEIVAFHCEQGCESDSAVKYLKQAARKAETALAFDHAARLYRRILVLGPGDPIEEAQTRLLLARVLVDAGRCQDAAQEFLMVAEDETRDDTHTLQRLAAEQFLLAGHMDTGMAVMSKVARALGMRFVSSRPRLIASVLLRSLWLRLRGLKIRPDARPSPHDTVRIDFWWALVEGLTVPDSLRALEAHGHCILLALKAGDKARIHRAVAWKATVTARQGPDIPMFARLQAEAKRLEADLKTPYARHMNILTKAVAATSAGKWAEARAQLSQVETGLRNEVPSAVLELGSVRLLQVVPLYYCGAFATLRQVLDRLLEDAQERGNIHNAIIGRSGLCIGAWLARDDVQGAHAALRFIEETSQRLGFPMTLGGGHLGFAASQTLLYQGDCHQAWAQLEARWRAIRFKGLPFSLTIRVALHDLRARMAIAVRMTGSRTRKMTRIAHKTVRRLEAEDLPWCRSLAHLLCANLAFIENNPEEAQRLLERAAEGFRDSAMACHEAVARYCLGLLGGGDQGTLLIKAAGQTLSSLGIADIPRTVALFSPGFRPCCLP